MVEKNSLCDNRIISEENLKRLLDLLKTTQYGSVTLVVQDGVVIQMERNEKLRLRWLNRGLFKKSRRLISKDIVIQLEYYREGGETEKMIKISNLSKTFKTPYGNIEVLKNIDLEIEKGDIFGIIGFSGAGKSTLVRCINRLEEPDTGKILIGDKEITALGKKDLREARKKIGMIFQQFNLFDSRTVFDNISFSLEVAGYKKVRIKERVDEILELVELKDKKNAYPLQLSGGQKQRVGIARALANNPDVLLSDEATSALDPQTTYSILELLNNINKKLNLTIVLITHELDVLRYSTNNMAVLEQGKIVERGPTESLFLNPKSDTSKRFISITNNFQRGKDWSGGDIIWVMI